MCARGRHAQILDEDYFVLRLVVEQLVRNGSYHCNAESSRTNAELVADRNMGKGFPCRLAHGGMNQFFEIESGAGICYPVKEYVGGTQVSNPHFAVRVQFPAPLHSVH